MHPFDAHTLSIIYRLLHLVGMAILVGGAVFVAAPTVTGMPERQWRLVDAAARYEGLFWPIIALQVLTGIGNLGVLGASVPIPTSEWGTFLAIKLTLVLFALFLSLIRTGLVAQLIATPGASLLPPGARLLRSAYLGTALVLGLVVFMAVRLAHG